MFNRRFLMAGGLAMAGAPFVARIAQAQAQAPAGRPMLVFMGYETSEECKTWRSKWEPIFVGTPAYKKMDYRAIYPATVSLLLKQESWPADIRWVLDTFLASEDGAQRGTVVPRFLLVQNQQVIFTATGNKGWQEAMWPTIMDVTATKA
jgi:hypothetical protein